MKNRNHEKNSKEEIERMSYFIPNDILKRYAFFLGDFTTFSNLNAPVTIQNIDNPTEQDYKNIMLFLQKEFTYIPKVPQYILNAGLERKPGQINNELSPQPPLPNFNRNKLSNYLNMDRMDNFFVIYYELERLRHYKKMILNILKGFKSTLENIVVDPNRYNIQSVSPQNIFSIQEVNNPSKTFLNYFDLNSGRFYHIYDFIYAYQQNSHSLFNYNGKSETPFFLKVFTDNYQDKSKKFILQMLLNYMDVVKYIRGEFTNNYGILAFEYLINLHKKPTFQLRTERNKTRNNFDLNFENQSIYNEAKSNMNVHNINAINQSQNSFNYMALNSEENIYEMSENENLIVENQKEIIQKLFNAICSQLSTLYKKRTYNLYELLTISIELDYLTSKFILQFIKPSQLKKALDTKKKIFKYIQGNLELYNTFIQDFMTWIKKTKKGLGPVSFLDRDQKLAEVYKSFFKFYFDMFQKTKSERQEDIRQRLEEAGLEYKIDESEGMSADEIEELRKMIQSLESVLSKPSSP